MPTTLTVARKTLALVRLITELEEEERLPTQEEQARLADWYGWGPAWEVFDETASEKLQAIGAEILLSLGKLCGTHGMDEAKHAIPNSYFTDPLLTRAVWRLVTRLGFAGGRVLEPGCGSGLFISSAPSALSIKAVGIEGDPFTAKVARYRLPDAEIIESLLQDVALSRRRFDLVVGNPPFGSLKIKDEESKNNVQLSVHNYFALRGLRALRPGGLLVFITSRYLLDAQEDWQRKYLEKYADFLGAIRLPAGAHKAAGTEVITDLLVFRRREDDTPAQSAPWLTLSPDVVEGVDVNTYFEHHPERMLGHAEAGRGHYRENEITLQMLPDFWTSLEQAVDTLAAELLSERRGYVPSVDVAEIDEDLVVRREDQRIEGSFYLENGKPIQIVAGEVEPVTRYREEIAGLLAIRDAALALLDAEADLDAPDECLDVPRAQLNHAYDTYVARYGPILRSTLVANQKDEDGETITRRKTSDALRAIAKDFHHATLLGLVEYSDLTHTERKADIFFHRIKRRPTPRMTAHDISEAVAICLDQHACLKLDVLAQLLSTTPDNIPSLLGPMAYEDPMHKDTWIPANLYLSGNVRLKLKQATRAVRLQGPRFQRNVDALEPLIPTDLTAEDIHAELGVTWVEPKDIAQFVYDLVQMTVSVVYEPVTSTWAIHVPKGVYGTAASISTWGTDRMDAIELLEKSLNHQAAIVYDPIGKGEYIKNEDKTIAVQEKQHALRERFSGWIWEDADRTEHLVARYNDIFRAEIPTKFDGSFLTFPGMSPVWAARLHPWQRNFVARMLSSRSALCVHPVGAGKTLSMITGGMKLRQLGFINRAGIVVPNHLLPQIASEAKRLYPDARILLVSPNDLKKEHRAVFAARVAFGEYDLVIMTHGALYRLGMHPESEYAYLEERIRLFDQMLRSQRKEKEKSRAKSRTLKGIENRILVMRERQRSLLRKKVEGITFEQLGLSCLFIDECQFYKNLGLPTNSEGFTITPALRAVDLEMKLRWLERNNGGQPFAAFFSATPWANNMAEAYVMMHYLCRDRLVRYGLESLDAFISNFVKISEEIEVSADGSTFQRKERPRGFFNYLDLMDILRQVADIQPPKILDSQRPELVQQVVPIEASPEIRQEIQKLVARAEKLRGNGAPVLEEEEEEQGPKDNMLRIVMRARQLSVSPRLCDVSGHSVKVEAVAKKVHEIWQKCQQNPIKLAGTHQSLQILFCDLGCPSEKGDQVYGEIKRGLVALGMPANAIRFIHEAKNDVMKADLFARCRSGDVAVLIGSTEKLGTGTNVQDRCVAIHMVAPPWRPDMIQQCIGRAHRPGNNYQKVYQYSYVVTGTFDAFMWQTLERKEHFMAQLLAGEVTEREIDIQSDMELGFAELKAVATGNPLLLEQASVDMEVARLQRLAYTYTQARERDRQNASKCRAAAFQHRERAKKVKLLADFVAQSTTPGFFTLEKEQLADRQAIGLYIMGKVFSLVMEGRNGTRQIGTWSGARVSVRVEGDGKSFTAELLIDGDWGAKGHTTIPIEAAWMQGGEAEVEQDALLPVEQPEEEKDKKKKKGPQQWRIAYAIEQFFTNALQTYQTEIEWAERQDQNVATLEAQAQVPFPQEAQFRALMARKLVLDQHMELESAGTASEEEIEAARRHLLATATRDYSQELGIMETRAVEEVFTLSPKAIASLRELEGMTVPLEVSVSDVLPETAKPIVAQKPTGPTVVQQRQQERLTQITEEATAAVEKMNLDELIAVSLFDDVAPRSLKELNKRKRKPKAPVQREETPTQGILFGSLR